MEQGGMQAGPDAMAPQDLPIFRGITATDALLRQLDWAATPLGSPRHWPAALRTAASLVLDSPVPMWLAWGAELTLVYNDAYAPMLGTKHPRALAAPLQQVWSEVWDDVAPLLADAMAGRGVHREDMPLQVDRFGEVRPAWFTFSYLPVRDEAGEVRGLVCTVLDTTDKVTTQQRLDDHELSAEADRRQRTEIAERYRLAALATNDAIWDWRLDDGHVIWNQALGTLFGHRHGSTSAQWWLDHIHPDDRPRVDADIHAVIDGNGTAWTGQYRFLCADGSHADIFDRGYVLRDAEGRAVRMIGAMQDLSSSKATEAALRDSERQYQALFERIDEGFCIIEFLDGPHGPMSDYVHVSANPAYLANAGIADAVGKRVREMVPAEAEGWVDIYRRVLVTGEPVRFERELVATGRYLELAAFRVEPPEKRQVAVLFQDVTTRHRAEIALRELNDTLERRVQAEVAERLRAEEALRQAQKMEAVGQLTGGIAHDFNNMLAVVLSALDLLSRKFLAHDAPALRYVEVARNGARRAAQLTQRLLAFSRQQPLKPETLDINKLVAGMSDLLRHSLGGNVQLETVLAGGLWRTHADPNQLENAILNLAVNGRDAMDMREAMEGGRLTIETANCHLDERYVADQLGLQVGQYVMVAVTDTGIGMGPDIVAKAFDPFFTTKEVGRGTGLGLSQVYGFVKQSGGHVRIYSEPGQGTTVKLYMPRQHGPAGDDEGLAVQHRASPANGRELILVVEDEPAVRAMSVDALAELGYRVLEADGAETALRLLDAHPDVALMFTDVVMPGVNGRRLADEARRRRPGLKVLFTTGYTRNAVVHNGVLDAGVSLIGKPYTLDELAARVREVLDAEVPLPVPPR